MQPTVSIVIPVYNSAKYLRQCLDSVVHQTYTNLQILCVDDCSRDDSWLILQEYAAADPRFCIFQKENEGVSLARNYALDRAEGGYLLFLDSDDWMDPETCEKAVQAAEKSQADVILWSYIRESEKDSQKKIIYEEDRLFDRQAVRDQIYRRMAGAYGEELSQPENADVLCTVWGKLYRRELIEDNHIRFYDIRKIGTHEDGLFNLHTFAHVNKAIFLNQYFYHYRRDNNASLTMAHNPNLRRQREVLYDLMWQYISVNEPDPVFRKAISNRVVLSLISIGCNEMESTGGMGSKIQSIKKIISRKQYREAISEFEFHYLPLHWKVFFTFARMNCASGVYFLLLIIQKIRGRT